ncbi:hypothetical protein DFH06DRAFT_131334 [Mycena polygramma]|nr:hypothetical protein DFH06DRAFT_131334 [Mycena polygramma]
MIEMVMIFSTANMWGVVAACLDEVAVGLPGHLRHAQESRRDLPRSRHAQESASRKAQSSSKTGHKSLRRVILERKSRRDRSTR